MGSFIISALALAAGVQAHIAAFGPGMYCQNGADPANPNFNSNDPVSPLYQLTQEQWWFHADNGCDKVPPPEGQFLQLPAGGSFDVQLANNQAFTNFSYGGREVTLWPDGGNHPLNWNGWNGTGEGCIQDSGWIHTQNETSAQGTAFAIAYKNGDLSQIEMEDLTVFTVLEHTPFFSAVTYQVPAAMPACPPGGCTCAWLWVPRGCGQPNIYMAGFKCMVTGATSTTPVGKAQPPVMCDTNPSQCVKGPKQMIAWNQATGNNVVTTGSQTPAYNLRNGFAPGAQNDIFEGAPVPPAASSSSGSSTASVSISVSPSAPTKVQSLPQTTSAAASTSVPAIPISRSSTPLSSTTLSTVIKPTSAISSTTTTPTGTTLLTVTVTVTAPAATCTPA